METHDEQLLRLPQELPRKDQHHIRRIAHLSSGEVRSRGKRRRNAYLGLLCLRSHDEELCRRMHDLDLAYDRRGVRGNEKFAEVVYEQFVPSFGHGLIAHRSMRGVYSAPFGPKLVRTRSESSLTAWIFRRTASSIPDRCYNAAVKKPRNRSRKQARTLYPSLNSWIWFALGTLSDMIASPRGFLQSCSSATPQPLRVCPQPRPRPLHSSYACHTRSRLEHSTTWHLTSKHRRPALAPAQANPRNRSANKPNKRARTARWPISFSCWTTMSPWCVLAVTCTRILSADRLSDTERGDGLLPPACRFRMPGRPLVRSLTYYRLALSHYLQEAPAFACGTEVCV